MAAPSRADEAGRERDQLHAVATQVILGALAERVRQEFGECPRCRDPVRGFDYLVRGRCPQCEKALAAFLTPRPQAGALERDEYFALLGALGGLVALAGAGEAPG